LVNFCVNRKKFDKSKNFDKLVIETKKKEREKEKERERRSEGKAVF